jgi:hypothetical protein
MIDLQNDTLSECKIITTINEDVVTHQSKGLHNLHSRSSAKSIGSSSGKHSQDPERQDTPPLGCKVEKGACENVAQSQLAVGDCMMHEKQR